MSFGARETLDNPALLAGLHCFDLLAHELDDDFITNVTVGLQRLLDALTVLLILLRDLVAEKVTDGDALKVSLALVDEISLKTQGNSLMLAAWGSNKNDARSYTQNETVVREGHFQIAQSEPIS